MTETVHAGRTGEPARRNLVGMALDEVAAALAPLGEPGDRARQVYTGG